MRNKRILSLFLSAVMALSLLIAPAAAAAPVFSDTDGHWAQQAIERWSAEGILEGYQGAFRPDETLTRAELAAMLTRLMRYQTLSDQTFADVEAGAWYARYVSLANAAGVLLGDGTGMRPNDAITRQEAMCMLARALGVQEDAGAIDRYDDQADVADWAAGLVGGLTAQGYVQGSDGLLRPAAPITRAETVTILNNAIAARYDSASTVSRDSQGDVIVSAAGVTLENMTIDGNLILSEGIGEGEVTLDGVTVTGDTLVRGGGEHSVLICGSSEVPRLLLQRRDGGVRILVEQDAAVGPITVLPGSQSVIVDGETDAVLIQSGAAVTIAGVVETVTITGEGAEVTITGEVQQLSIAASAQQAAITVQSGAVIAQAHSAADGVTVSGGGTIEQLTITGGQDVAIGADTTVSDLDNQGDSPVDLGGQTVAPGETGSQTPEGEGPGGGPGEPESGVTVTTAEELTAALETASVSSIRIDGTLGSDSAYTSYTIDRPVTIRGGTVYGTFNIAADGVTLTGITFYNQGDESGQNTLSRNAVNAYTDEITIRDCTFRMTSGATGIVNGVLLLPSRAQVDYTVTGNAFYGYENSDSGYSSTALLISGGTVKAGLNDGNASVLAQLSEEEDLAMITGNTYENCKNDYTRSDWTDGNQVYCASNSASDNFRLSYAAEGARFYVTGDVTRRSDTTLKAGSQLTILPGATLTLPQGVTLTNQGRLIVDGTLTGEGTLTDGAFGVGDVSGTGLVQLPTALAELITDFGFAKQEEPENITGEMYFSTKNTVELAGLTVTYGGQALETQRTEYDSMGGDQLDHYRYAFQIPAEPQKSESEYNQNPAVAAFSIDGLGYELRLTTTVLDTIFGL